MKLIRIPILTPLAFIVYLGMLAVVPGSAPPERTRVAHWTIGDLRRLPYPDNTPVVVLNFGGGSSYKAIGEPKIAVACPDDLRVNWFDPEDSRANGRVAQQTLLIGTH